jgi:Ca2+/H+ antiporter, TMEM165/GDT1 family
MFSAFIAGLLLITISELGDKTFFIAAILAMRHPRKLVFAGAIAALASMTVLSVLLGSALSFLPKSYLHYGEIVLFIGFGLKLLFDASQMPAKTAPGDEKAALEAVNQSAAKRSPTVLSTVFQAFSLTFVAEWGDRTQISTIALAASYPPLGVTLGAILGHAICAAIAVIGGRWAASRISERTITALGGALFLLFGLVSGWEGTSIGSIG